MNNIWNTRVLVKKTSLLLFIMIITIMDIFPCAVMASETEDKKYGDKIIMVSLGDSYSAGEGIEPFYGQLEALDLSRAKPKEAESFFAQQAESQDFLAHRSQKSWPGQLRLPGIAMPMNYYRDDSKDDIKWYFCAVSGARTYDFENSQEKLYIKALHDQLTDTQIIFEYQKFLDPQKAVFDKIPKGETDYITMTMGGNDAKFEKVIESCAVGSTYLHSSGLSDMLENIWEDFYSEGGIKDRLSKLYSNLEIAAGKQAKILVAGYPRLLDEAGKGKLISQSEAEQVNNSISKFNNEIEKLITEKNKGGMNIYFVSVEGEDNFDGHGAFSKDPYINPIYFRKRFTDLKDLAVASAFSMHPNEKGAEVYRKCIQKKIDQLEGVEEDADLNKEAADNIDEEKIYKEYVAETVIPQIGASNMETFTATMKSQDPDQHWGNRNGLFAMDIRDLNNDRKKELLLYICKPYEINNEYGDFNFNNGLVVEIYSIDQNGQIYKTCEEFIGDYGGTVDHIFGGGYLYINDDLYLLVESMGYGLVANGIIYSMDLYKFDNNACIHLENCIFTYGGSSAIAFGYKTFNANKTTEEVFWGDGWYLSDHPESNVTYPPQDYSDLDAFKLLLSRLGISCPKETVDIKHADVPCFSNDENSMDHIFRIDNHGEYSYTNIYEPEINYVSSAQSWYSEDFDTTATFIIPDSSDRLITDVVLQNFDAKKLELARNEIFARHGRKFKTDYIQDYFNSKAWYRGTIEPDDFDSNVFNDFEKENINFLLETENGVSEKKSPSTSAGFTPEQAQEIIFNYLYDEVSDFAGDTFGVDPGYGSRSSMEYIAYFSVGEAAYQYATVTVNLDTGDGRVQYVYDYDAEIYDAFGVWPETMIPEYDINLYDIQ